MDNAARHNTTATASEFTLQQRTIPRHHQVQFYMDHGRTAAGPWFKVGLNDTEYVVGFIPKHTAKKAHLHPVGETT